MTVVTGSLSYFVIWWLVLFAVLPWGASKTQNPLPGQDLSAPEKPRLAAKFLITTLLAVLVWGGLFWFLQSSLN